MSCFTATLQDEGAVFLSEVPNDLTCVICSLVLKDPLQVMLCGHRYCSSCFGKMRKHANDSNLDLLCPIDRNPVEMDKVFPDNAAARTIRNLTVKCKGHEHGCQWTGCFGDVNEHYSTCKYIPKHHSHDNNHSQHHVEYTELLQRVIRCEQDLEAKEKDLVFLKFTVKEMKDGSNKDREEIKTLKGSLAFLLNEVHILKQKNEENVNKYDGEINDLHEKNNLMEKEITDCKKEIKTITETKLALEDHIDQQIKTVEKKVETELESIQKEVRLARSHIDKSLTKQKAELGNIEDLIKVNNEPENSDNLRKKVHLIENTLFLFNSVKSKKLQLKWILDNFDHHYNVGKPVYSPVFNSQVSGYRFKLVVEWTEDKKNMGFFLQLCRGKNENGLVQNLPPFRHEYSFEILNKNGVALIDNIIFEDLEDPDADISIPDGKDEVEWGYGFPRLISLPFDNYIIRDSMYIMCTLHLV